MKPISYKIVLPGIGASSNRGALGWCSVSLIFTEDKTILFDTGSNDDREEFLHGLKKLEMDIKDIDIVFISHLHYDHCCNIELFDSADIMVSQQELNYVLTGEYRDNDDPYVPGAVINYFADRFQVINDGDLIAKGARVMLLPGHTPGSAGLLLENEKILFAGDAVKNAWDFTHAIPPKAIYDKKEGLNSYGRIRKNADMIIPGHGRPFELKGEKIIYVGDHDCTRIKLYPNEEYLNALDERVYQQVIL